MDDIDILAVVGSTKFNDDIHSWHVAYSFLEELIKDIPPNIIVSGGALGIDSIARSLALELNIEFEEYLPNNPHWEPNGYRERNIKIAESCTRLVCVRHFDSKTYGSGWTADYAERIGKPVKRYKYNSNYAMELQ